MQPVKFLFDFGSPNAFLAHRAIPALERRTGATFEYVPVLLGGLFKLTGNQSPATAFAGIKNKPAYEMMEVARFVKRHGIADFRSNPFFPINTLHLMRGAVAAQRLGVLAAYVDRIFDDMWTRQLDMGQPENVSKSLSEAGLPGADILALSQIPEVKQALLDNTQSAFEAGAFGSPSFLVGDELYFGKDRLRDVEEAITGGGSGAAVLEANKKVVMTAYDLALNHQDIEAAVACLSPDYKQHNPTVPDGIAGWKGMVTYIKENQPGFSIDIKRVFADGDYVLMHVFMKRSADDRGSAVVEIFRLKDGLISEHWDVIQPVPETSANANTMF